jgi:hypothetical protein
LLVPLSAQTNIERVKLKARALRLKEEYRYKYLTRRSPSVVHRRTSTEPSTEVPPALEEPLIEPDYIESIPSRLRRTLTFCISLWFAFLIAIAICIFSGYYLKYILSR